MCVTSVICITSCVTGKLHFMGNIAFVFMRFKHFLSEQWDLTGEIILYAVFDEAELRLQVRIKIPCR